MRWDLLRACCMLPIACLLPGAGCPISPDCPDIPPSPRETIDAPGFGTITDLGPDDISSFATDADVNESGQVVMNVDSSGTTYCTRAFLLQSDSGLLVQLGKPLDRSSSVRGLNDLNQSVGTWYPPFNFIVRFPGPPQAVLWEDGVATVLPVLPEDDSAAALGINNLSHIVGRSVVSEPHMVHLVRWEKTDGRWRVLDLEVVLGTGGSVADINDLGRIAGVLGIPDANTAGGFRTKPFQWDAGVLTMLPTLNDLATNNSVYAINDSNQIVGSSAVNAASSPGEREISHAVLWQDGQIIDLEALPEERGSRANDINNAGTIVGNSGDGPFIWKDGVMTILKDLFADDVDITFHVAYAINDAGQILAAGTPRDTSGQPRMYLLTPEP